MVSSAFILAAISMAASSVGPAADAFAPSSAAPAAGRRTAPASASRPLRAVDEADARALSDYLSKSHEERLRAVREVEERKNAEIEALKAKIASAIEMESKLESYQSFMEKYVVDAQNQKLAAVREAELNAKKRTQERLEKQLQARGTQPSDGGAGKEAAAAPAAVAAVEETASQKSDAPVVASAEAGKSRQDSILLSQLVSGDSVRAGAPANGADPTRPKKLPNMSLRELVSNL